MAWSGLSEFSAALKQLETQTDLAVKEFVAKGAALTVKEAQANFSGTHKAGRPHVGSNGGYPNVPSPGGNLRRSIIMQPIVRTGIASYSTSVGPTAIYSRAIELGLWQNPSIKYPFFVPGAKRAASQFPDLVLAAYRNHIH